MTMKIFLRIIALFALLLTGVACKHVTFESGGSSCAYAKYFDIQKIALSDSDSVNAVVTISPYTGYRDTLIIEEPLDNIICMSSSQVAGLASIDADSVISAVSGLRYVTNPKLHQRNIPDIGYESSLDYETILSLNPDLLLTYTVSGAEPPFISRLRSLGVRVLVLHDHLEEHPLARAEYIRLYGSLTGREEYSDSVYTSILSRYAFLKDMVDSNLPGKKVLMNIPYGDAWYIPGGNSYMACLISDAGGEILGARSGESRSRIITLEEAYRLSLSADIWLNPGPCRTKDELVDFHHAFHMFGPIEKGLPIYSNTLRMTPEGGNDFWESGSVRPDLILQDLISIFSGDTHDDSLEYHFQVK